jgi:hypothetical protein
MKALLFFLISSLCSFSQTKAPLGLPETLEDLYIPGPKIEVIPRTNNDSPLVIRILKSNLQRMASAMTWKSTRLTPGHTESPNFYATQLTKARSNLWTPPSK